MCCGTPSAGSDHLSKHLTKMTMNPSPDWLAHLSVVDIRRHSRSDLVSVDLVLRGGNSMCGLTKRWQTGWVWEKKYRFCIDALCVRVCLWGVHKHAGDVCEYDGAKGLGCLAENRLSSWKGRNVSSHPKLLLSSKFLGDFGWLVLVCVSV